ncbi:MAG: lysophospholipid acyltransferase family protein [Acidimicrobiia bacterium]|nr:lysophospholipid acyltransferase family protein [Acidimicrobiia bacterium]
MNRRKYLPGYLLYRVLSGLFGLLPEPAMRRAGEGIGWLLSFVAGDRRRMSARHLRRVMGEGDDVDHLVRQAFSSYGRYWAETFWVRPRRLEEMAAHTSIEGDDIVRAYRDTGGLIFALPHLGNWEAAGIEATVLGLDLVAAAESLPNPLISDWFIAQRAVFGIEVVLVKPGASQELLARLHSGKTLALPSDRDLKGRGVAVKFFGEQTTLPAGPFVLAKRTGAPVLPVATYFKEKRGHHFVVRPPLDPGGSVEDMAQELAEHFEDFIRAHPTQWHLLQPLWPSDLQEPT